MNQKINSYLESLVLEILQIPEFVKLSDEQKSRVAEKLRDHLNNVILDTVIDKLTPEQITSIKDIPADSSQMEEKMEEFTSTMPFLIKDLEVRLDQKVSEIKKNPLSWAI